MAMASAMAGLHWNPLRFGVPQLLAATSTLTQDLD
jgi:hypothetical protein